MKTIYLDKDNYLVRGTPAAVSREDGTLYINSELWEKLTPFQQTFIKWHEVGHYRLNTSDEFAADRYAFKKMAGKYYQSLKKMIGTLEAFLDDKRADHKSRIEAMYDLALDYDAQHGNKAAADELKRRHSKIERGDGESKAESIRAEGDSNAALIDAITRLQVDGRNAEANDDNSNQLMLYLLIAVIVIVLFKK